MMLKNLKSTRSTTSHQLSDVIYKKIQSCYQLYHYYHNDLIYKCKCNIRSKENKVNKRKKHNAKRKRSRGIVKETNTRLIPTTAKYQCNCKSAVEVYSNYRRKNNSTIVNFLANVCFYIAFKSSEVNLKINQLSNNLRNICVCFERKSNNSQLMLVMISLAFITCTAQSIDTQVKSQQNPTTSPRVLASASITTTTKFSDSYAINCQQQIPNASLGTPAKNSFNFQTNICRDLRQRYHNYLQSQKKHLQLNTRKSSKSLNYFNKSSSKLFTEINTNSFNQEYSKTKTRHYENNIFENDIQDVEYNKDFNNHNDSTIVISKPRRTYKNKNDGEQKHQPKLTNSNIDKFFKNLRTNNYYNEIVSYKTNNNFNNITNLIKPKLKNLNDNFNEHVDDLVEIKSLKKKLKLLSPAEQSIHFQKHVDGNKLMKLVMDGLGLTKVPNMEKVNVSQEEYITKYREYLQRIHTRKRRELRPSLGNQEEMFLRPLKIYSIAPKNTLFNRNHELKRQKRNDHHKHDVDEDKKQSLEERVRSILLSKKKYQKPRSTRKERDERKTNIRLMFALKPEILNLSSSDIEEANIRLVVIHSPILAIRNPKNKKPYTKPKSSSCGLNKNEGQINVEKVNVLNLKLFFLPEHSKRSLLDGRKINIHVDHSKPDETHTQWLQFDVTKAIKTSIDENRTKHIVLELQCDHCKRFGARILNDAYNTADDALAHDPFKEGQQLMPVLNIIGRFDQSERSVRPHRYEPPNSNMNGEATTQRNYHHQTTNNNDNPNNRRTDCYKANQRCCRHSMEVTFKEIKGFEFIIQPKVFDAGYCRGRCPPRYNPAHHHALLQSLIWKQNHRNAPRPCCAPSKLVELEVLHVDEKDSNKLKISTWSDMKVVECACS